MYITLQHDGYKACGLLGCDAMKLGKQGPLFCEERVILCQGRRVSQFYCYDSFFIMLVTFHQSTCCLIPEDRIFVFTAVTISDLTSHSSFSVAKTAGLHGFLFTVVSYF